MTLLGRLVALREIAGLTQSELSRLALLRRTYVGQLERRPMSRELELNRIVALAHVLGVSLDYLVLGRGKAPEPAGVIAAVERAKRAPGDIAATIESALGVQPRPPVRRRPALRAKALPRRALPAAEARS